MPRAWVSWSCSLNSLVGVAADERELLDVENRSVDERGLVGEEVDGGHGDLLGLVNAAGGRDVFGQAGGPVGRHAVTQLELVFVGREGPAGVQLIDLDAFGGVRIGKVAGKGGQAALGDGVDEIGLLAAVGVDGADVEHAAVSLLVEVGNGGADDRAAAHGG